MISLQQFQKQFNTRLSGFFASRLKVYSELGTETVLPQIITHAQTIALAGGKRVRPYIAQLAYESFGGKKRQDIQEIGVGLELLHLFALAHDDIVDRGMLRHGKPTTQIYTETILRSHKRIGDLSHISNGQALLVGDLLFAWSQEMMQGSGVQSVGRRRACEAYRRMVDEVIVGEMLDIDLTTQRVVPLEMVKRKHILKTARYSFSGPIAVGARLAVGRVTHDAFAKEFGEALGLAFQIQDDMLDVVAGTGKTACVDVQEGQHTYLSNFVFTQAKPVYAKQLRQYFGKPEALAAAEQITQLFAESGALAYAHETAGKLFAKSRTLLQASSVAKNLQGVWLSFIDTIEHRSS